VKVVRTSSPAPIVDVPPSDSPRVSFVLVAYGTGPILLDTLASIVATTGEIAYEVIVVDNPHPRAGDRTYTDLLLSTHGVRVLQPDTNLGFGGGCNAGAGAAQAEYLCLLNPDVTLPSGWLPPLLEVLEHEDASSVVAPTLLDDDGAVQECGQILYADGTTRPRRRPADGTPFEADYASAACWVTRTASFRALGGFDPAFHPAYFEDVDYVLRTRRAGGRCVVHPGVAVTHHQGRGTPDAPSPAHHQRELLVAKWPELAATQPVAPSG